MPEKKRLSVRLHRGYYCDHVRILILFVALTRVALAQQVTESVELQADSAIRLATPNSTMVSYPNLEYVSASPAAPLSSVFIRSMGNPLITVDGIPQSISIFGTLPFRQFVSFPQPLG